MLKKLWLFWIDFTEFRAVRKCHIDEIIYGNSIRQRMWWGYRHIPYPKFMQSQLPATPEQKEK